MSGLVSVVLMLRRRPRTDLPLGQWILAVGFSVVTLLAGVVVLNVPSQGSGSPGF
ncbi:MAG TPA: hypothetical protein VFM38_00390 [Candidatus Limnocylindrales bacterium]|nr:hypothetical protein [Candidatus Limnocylindrales bacterium]